MAPVPPTRSVPLRCPVAAVAVLLAAGWLSLPVSATASPQARAGAIESASRATVFLRVIGDIEVVPAIDLAIGEKRLQRNNVEIATGSGVLISPLGQVLTCQHVVADGERSGLLDGRRAKVLVKVRRIEAFVPAVRGSGSSVERFEASLVAASGDLDVAVLSISGATFPSADLGDSDALEPGDGLDALGFPFGREVEIGRPLSAAPPAPEVSVSHGDFSAFRADELGTRRFIQTSAMVNPGNSGGPLLDGDGYVVGIVSRRLSAAGTGIGFAVPINLVKEFLESSGLDGQLPARRLSLAPAQSFEGKGLRVRLPWGLSDVSPYRARVDTGGNPAALPTLRIDRLLSSWDVVRLADALSSGQALDPFAPSSTPQQRVRLVGGRRVVTGRVNGTSGDGAALRIEYAVFDLGPEKVLARYLASAAQLAYNASVFRASLASLEAESLRRTSPPIPQPSAWAPFADAGVSSNLRSVTIPAGWVVEPLAPLPCQGVVPAAEAVSASPLGDFARTLRVGVVRQVQLSAAAAAGACGTPIAAGATAYQGLASWFGTSLFVEGRFVQVAEDEFLHFEVVGPAEQRTALHELFGLWMARLDAPVR